MVRHTYPMRLEGKSRRDVTPENEKAPPKRGRK